MGSEPCSVTGGPLAGTSVFVPRSTRGPCPDALARRRPAGGGAVLRASIRPATSRPSSDDSIDGRMVAGAFKDNAVIPYAGVGADALTDAQRGCCSPSSVPTSAGPATTTPRCDDRRRGPSRRDPLRVDGATDDDGPFYYRVQSPVVLIEFDHHPGIVFDNLEPSRHHVHSHASHAQRRRLRHRPAAPAPRAVRPLEFGLHTCGGGCSGARADSAAAARRCRADRASSQGKRHSLTTGRRARRGSRRGSSMSVSVSACAAEVMLPSMSKRVPALKPRSCVRRYSDCWPASRGMCCWPFSVGPWQATQLYCSVRRRPAAPFSRRRCGAPAAPRLRREVRREIVHVGVAQSLPPSATSAGPCGCPRGT